MKNKNLTSPADAPSSLPAMRRDWALHRARRLKKDELNRQMAIARITPDLVATADMDGFLTSLNPAGYRMLGLEAGFRLQRMRLSEFYTPAGARNLSRIEIPGAISNRVWHSETTVQSRGGEQIPVSQILIVHRDSDDNVDFFSVILRDLRPVKEAENERQQLAEQLFHARKMETIGRLASGIAHDFNNILTVIVGYAELGLASVDEKQPLHEELQVILDSAQKASRLSSQLLDFSSKQRLEPEVLDLNEVMHESHQLLESLMGEEVRIECIPAQASCPVLIDRSKLEQVILNLAVNARDAMPLGGRVTLRTQRLSLSYAQACKRGLERSGEYVLLSVSDTGEGMPAEVLEHIFEPFYTTKEFGKGTGLGLSSVYGSVTQNCGHIEVDSTPGLGTSFDIYLPLASAQGPRPLIEGGDDDYELMSLRGEQVLLVEDNASTRALLNKVLSSYGYRVFAAEDAERAWQIFQEHGEDICLVVSDIVMPGTDGTSLCRQLREIRPGLKSLLISGHTDKIASLRERKENGVHLLCKPFDNKKLAREIRSVLDDVEELV